MAAAEVEAVSEGGSSSIVSRSSEGKHRVQYMRGEGE